MNYLKLPQSSLPKLNFPIIKPIKIKIPKENISFGKSSSREPLPAKVKNKVKDRVRKRFGRVVCEQCGKKPRLVALQYHHKNMKNTDNRVKNLILLCPNHHMQKHRKGQNPSRKPEGISSFLRYKQPRIRLSI